MIRNLSWTISKIASSTARAIQANYRTLDFLAYVVLDKCIAFVLWSHTLQVQYFLLYLNEYFFPGQAWNY
jgi:hypothetical protein